MKILPYKKSLGTKQTNQLLVTLGESLIDTTIIEPKEMKALERHIRNDINEFTQTDFPLLLANLMKLNYVSQVLIDDLNLISSFSAFPVEGSMELLKQITLKKIPDQKNLHLKLWDRVELHSDRLNSGKCH